MEKFRFTFTGRQSGAIGIFYRIADTYKAKDVHEAISLLYEDYEHINSLSIFKNGTKIEPPKNINWVQVRSHRTRERQKDGATYQYNRTDTEIQ